MKTYELIFVFDSALEMGQIESEMQKVRDGVLAAAGTLRKWERWGKRRLTYEIRGKQYGYYVLVVFDLEPQKTAEMDRSLRHNPNVIRHLITVVEPKRVPEVDAEAVKTLGATQVVEAKEEGAVDEEPIIASAVVADEAVEAEVPGIID